MKSKLVLTIGLTFAFLLTSLAAWSQEGSDKIVIIVNNENPVSPLTASEVKLYYLRKIKKRWPEINKNIRPVDRKKKCVERDAFYFLLGMDKDQIEQYFVNKQLQNAERPPDKFATEEEVINFVSEEIGAIGYIRASSVTPAVKAKVKIVFELNPL